MFRIAPQEYSSPIKSAEVSPVRIRIVKILPNIKLSIPGEYPKFSPITLYTAQNTEKTVPAQKGIFLVRRFYCVYASRKDGHTYARTHEEIMARYGADMMMQEEMPPMNWPQMGRYMYTGVTLT